MRRDCADRHGLLFNTGLEVASTLLPLFSRFGSPPSEKLDLPDYE